MATIYEAQVWARGEAPPSDAPEFTLSLGELADPPVISSPTLHPLEGRTETQPWWLEALGDAFVQRFGENARPAILGRVVRFRRNVGGGGWEPLDTGRISNLGEPRGPGRHAVEVSDETWVGRAATIFGQTTGVQLYPFGLTEPFGPPWWHMLSAGFDTGIEVVAVDGDAIRVRVSGDIGVPRDMALALVGDLVEPGLRALSANNTDGNFKALRLDVTHVNASPTPATLPVLSINSDPLGGTATQRRIMGGLDPEANQEREGFLSGGQHVWAMWVGHGLSVGAQLTARLHFPGLGIATSEAIPLFIGGVEGVHLGQLLLDIRDGAYGGEPERIDPASRAALESDDLPRVWLMRTRSAKRAAWLAENVNVLFQTLPFPDTENGLRLLQLWTPGADDVDVGTLPLLNASTVDGPTWENVGRQVCNRIEVEFTRLLRDPDGVGLQRLKRETFQLSRNHDTAHLGTRERSLSTELVFEAGTEDALIRRLSSELFGLYGDGPIIRRLTAEAITLDLQPGDLVRLDASSLKVPNPVENARTGLRICRVMERRLGPVSQELVLLDFGPALQPLAAPTGSIAQDATDPALAHVTIATLPTGARATVEVTWAATDTQPADNEWRISDGGREVGTHPYRLDESGGFAHTRFRSTLPNRIPSAWVYDSVALSVRPIIRSVSTAFTEAGEAALDAEAVDTGGVRAHYEVHRADEEPPQSLGNTEDFAFPFDDDVLTDVTVPDGWAVTLEYEPFPAFSGGSVSGTPGARVRETLVRRADRTLTDGQVSWYERLLQAYVIDPEDTGTTGPLPSATTIRIKAVAGARVRGVRIHILGGPVDFTEDREVTGGLVDRSVNYSDAIGDDPVNLEKAWPRDGESYEVTLTPYTGFEAGEVTGTAGTPLVLVTDAPGGIAEPYSDAHPATRNFVLEAVAGGGGGGDVTSVFGRTGAVVAQANDYSFAQIGSKPTTLSGYGITDAYTKGETDTLLDGKAAVGHSHSLSSLGGLLEPTQLHGSAVAGDIFDVQSGAFRRIPIGDDGQVLTVVTDSAQWVTPAAAPTAGAGIDISGGIISVDPWQGDTAGQGNLGFDAGTDRLYAVLGTTQNTAAAGNHSHGHFTQTNNPHSVTKAQVGLGNVENTALSSWTGSTSITTLGTITTGVWSGSVITALRGGTGIASYTTLNYIRASGPNTLEQRTPTQVRSDISAEPAFATLGAAKGGTGRNTLTTGALLAGNGTSAVTLIGGTNGHFLKRGASSWASAAITAADVGAGVFSGHFRVSGGLAVGPHAAPDASAGRLTVSGAAGEVSFGDRGEGNATTNRWIIYNSAAILRFTKAGLGDVGVFTAGGVLVLGGSTSPGSATLGGMRATAWSQFTARVDMADPRKTSARWLKSEIDDLTGSVERIAALRPRSFRWRESGLPSIGFVADEVAAVDRRYGDDESWAADVVLTDVVASVQALTARVRALEAA